MKILVTGASGFIGSAVMAQLSAQGMQPVASTQRLSATADWSDDVSGAHAVIHCAARVHVMREQATDPLAAFRAVNVEGTLALAQQAAAAGVKRFIFLSSVKVNGEETQPEKPFTAEDTPAPEDAYGISKHEAEQGLRVLAKATGMELIIIRPPLVYGPGVKGNFASLVNLVARGIPLPFGAVHNRRSLVARDNLVDLIALCLTHPAAANETFLVSDGAALSTPELIRAIAAAMDKPARLIPVPPALFHLTARALRKPGIARRLCGSLELDITKTTALLGWKPVVTMSQALSA